MLEAITTIAAITLGHALTRQLSKDDGWKLAASPLMTMKVATEQLIVPLDVVGQTTAQPGFIKIDRSISRLELLRNELRAYQNLAAGWDGEESAAPEASHLSAASALLNALPAGLPLPKTMLSTNGEVGLYWNDDRWLADAVIEDESHFSLFIRSLKQGNHEIFVSSITIEQSASCAIEKAFSEIS
jgi:hypothetical protein